MERSELQQLHRLHELILQERQAARSLNMDRLSAIVREKEDLVRSLGTMEVATDEMEEDESGEYEAEEDEAEEDEAEEDVRGNIIRLIQKENRRNAYLFWCGLNLVRETMEFFGRQVPPPVYGPFGEVVQNRKGTHMLSGRI